MAGSNTNYTQLDKLKKLMFYLPMHIKHSLALYCLNGGQARIGIIVDVVPGMSRPYLVSDRFSKIRFWASEDEVLESIVPAQPSMSSARTPAG